MTSRLVMNVIPQEARVAVMENDRLAELYIERQQERGIVGNIYKGRVQRVLPGMQAAFVDVGLERAAFLYVTDFFEEYGDAFNQKEVEEEKRRKRYKSRTKIQDLLKEGQDVLVQVAKDPIGTKGARLTSHVSLPGRHLVYMPTVNHVGVSRKIENERERRRLKDLVQKVQTSEGGFIVRTAAAGQSDKNLEQEVEYLERLWEKVLRRHKGMKAPALIHEDLGLVQRTVRDFFTDDVGELIVDDKDAHRKIKQFVGQFLPKKKRKIHFYKGKEQIFTHYDIEPQIERAMARKVWLKSGGYLIIEQTEALTAIDINTGRFVGSKNLEETILKTNLEAVKEIVVQLRLRNIGGLIILDLIDMDRKSNREKVYRALEKALADDKAKTNVLQISELGLVEMTRRRTRENLAQSLGETCTICNGSGLHLSPRSVSYNIIRKLLDEIQNQKSHKNIEIVAHPKVADILKKEEYDALIDLENRSGRRIVVREQANINPEHFELNRTGLEFRPSSSPSTMESETFVSASSEEE